MFDQSPVAFLTTHWLSDAVAEEMRKGEKPTHLLVSSHLTCAFCLESTVSDLMEQEVRVANVAPSQSLRVGAYWQLRRCKTGPSWERIEVERQCTV